MTSTSGESSIIGCAIFFFLFMAIPSIIINRFSDDGNKTVELISDPIKFANSINDWYENSLDDRYYIPIPDGITRSQINVAYKYLKYDHVSGSIPITSYRAIVIHREDMSLRKVEKENESLQSPQNN